MKLALHHARTLATVLGFATITGGVVTVCWPSSTFADASDDPFAALEDDGTKLDDIVVRGELVKDAKSKTGWSVEVTAENKGAAPESFALKTELTSTQTNVMSRARPRAAVIWDQTETISLAAGEKVTKRYAVSAPAGAKINANKSGAPQAKGNARMAAMTRTTFGVRFAKAHA